MIPARLVLQSGESFLGYAPDWQEGHFFGEVVFTTGMTGYVESMTDPSFAGQILAFTYPLIGNYGISSREKWESGNIQVAGVICACVSLYHFHREAKTSFLDWLQKERIPLLTGIDTRQLAQALRKKGVALGVICHKSKPKILKNPNLTHLVKKVSSSSSKTYGSGEKTILLVDCGLKESIIHSLLTFSCKIKRVPFDYDYSNEDFDGLVLSNGPGDPIKCPETLGILKKNLIRKKPILGICLGAQLMALAIGGKTYKLKFGHRSQNHPCFDLKRKICLLTSQNHGYAIQEKSLPKDWMVWFRSLNDNSVQGICHRKYPFFAVQFHPESHPGPSDPFYVFKTFYESL